MMKRPVTSVNATNTDFTLHIVGLCIFSIFYQMSCQWVKMFINTIMRNITWTFLQIIPVSFIYVT